MFDFAWSEIALVGIVGMIFIGPKDMPTAIRAVTNMIKKGRKLAGEFQTHVDDMVRDADLGEARDSFRELRSLNLRGQVMKALDSDGTLRRTLSDNPLSPIPAATSSVIPGASAEGLNGPESFTGITTEVSGEEMLRRRNAPFIPMADLTPVSGQDHDPVAESDDPAPGIIPPQAARRLQRMRATPVPAFLPPGAMRPYPGPY